MESQKIRTLKRVDRKASVLVLYSGEYAAKAIECCRRLLSLGYEAQIDINCTHPWQPWKPAITQAMATADAVVVLCGKNCSRRGTALAWEVEQAVARARHFEVDDGYLIPVIIDETGEVPEQLQAFPTFVWLNEDDLYNWVACGLGQTVRRLSRPYLASFIECDDDDSSSGQAGVAVEKPNPRGPENPGNEVTLLEEDEEESLVK